MDRNNFVELALRTCSPNFYADRVSNFNFRHTINEAIDALTQLDKIKKSLFYGRDNNLSSEGNQDVSVVRDNLVINSTDDIGKANDIIHAILGIATEAGELLEQLRDAYNGQNVDVVNLMEECGDIKWYQALLSRAVGFEWGQDEAAIIDKLRNRFPEAYSDDNANERNLEVERNTLEAAIGQVQPATTEYIPETEHDPSEFDRQESVNYSGGTLKDQIKAAEQQAAKEVKDGDKA